MSGEVGVQAAVAPPQINIEGKSFKDLHNMGGRSYASHDYTTAVLYFSKASELGAKQLGDQLHDDLGDVYLLYGKSLLELARLEGDPFGENVPKEVPVGEIEAEEDDDDENKEAKEGDDNNEADESKNEADDSKNDEGEDVEDEEVDEEEEDENDEMDNSKNEEIEGIELNGEKISSTSGNEDKNKEGGSKTNEEEEAVEEEEEPSDLQLAWEILELAKIIFTKRENRGKSSLADTLITLGEISMESENVQSAITDIKEAVNLLETLEDKNNRMLAEAYYKLGMAVAMENKLEEAIDFYNKSKQVLENRMKDFEGSERALHKREVEDIKKIVPEIEEKIVDLRNFKEEQLKKLEESSSVVADDDPEKKPNDISHLVKRKRKSDVEDASCSNPPPKKPSLD